jgi:hypothetical protein
MGHQGSVMVKIKSMHQAEFLDEHCLLYDFKSNRPCLICPEVDCLSVGDGGAFLNDEALSDYNIYYFPCDMEAIQ